VPNTFGSSPRKRCVFPCKDRNAAVRQSPGPGDYDDHTNAVKRRPASFGIRGRLSIRGANLADARRLAGAAQFLGIQQARELLNTPGPGHYKPEEPGRCASSQGSRFSMASSPAPSEDYSWQARTGKAGPGPLDYSLNTSFSGISFSRKSKLGGSRSPEYSGMPAPACCPEGPGPASYAPEYSIASGSKRSIERGVIDVPHAPAHVFGTMPRFVQKAEGGSDVLHPGPGPGTYSLDPPSKIRSEGSRISCTPRRWHNSHLNPRETPRNLSTTPSAASPRPGSTPQASPCPGGKRPDWVD